MWHVSCLTIQVVSYFYRVDRAMKPMYARERTAIAISLPAELEHAREHSFRVDHRFSASDVRYLIPNTSDPGNYGISEQCL